MSCSDHASPFAFSSSALQYYAAGRFSAISLLMPVAGNLLHHAVEMFLKAALAHHISVVDLKKKYSHNLERIWSEFKAGHPSAQLTMFDNVVRKLHRFESIRYPSVAGDDPGFLQLVVGQDPPKTEAPAPPFQLVLNEIDAVVAKICRVGQLSLEQEFGMLRPEVQAVILAFNRCPVVGASSNNSLEHDAGKPRASG